MKKLVLPTVGIIGLGQIGGSIACSLIESACVVWGWDDNEETLTSAKTAGIEIANGLAQVVAQSNIVFVCVPLHLNKMTLESILQLRGELGVSPIITDVASYKRGTFPIGHDGSVVLGHPMAGSHGHGFSTADPSLFRESTWVLIWRDTNDPAEVAELTAVLIQTGARVRFCDISWHDQIVSLVSAVPHALAVVLGSIVGTRPDSDLVEQFAAGSFDSATRVLRSSNELICDLLQYNGPTLLPLLEQCRQQLSLLENTLRTGTRGDLSELVKLAQRTALMSERAKQSITVTEVPQSELGAFFRSLVNQAVEIVRVQNFSHAFGFELRIHSASEYSFSAVRIT